MNNFTTPDSGEIIYEDFYAALQAGFEPTDWIPPAFISEPEPTVKSNQPKSKAYRDMTVAEKEELQNKMNILHKLGFFIDGITDNFPSISHELFYSAISFDLSILELEDFVPLIYNLGKDEGMEAGRKELQHEMIEAEPA